jgi:hypothetical protein
MSLLTTASPWNTGGGTRKRVSSIGKRKTQRADTDNTEETDQSSDMLNINDFSSSEKKYSIISENFDSTMTTNSEREKTVSELLNKITASSSDAGSGLADFKPLANNLAKSSEGFESNLLKKAATPTTNPLPSDFRSDELSNYNKSYEAGGILGKPYYSSMGIAKDNGSTSEGNQVLFQKLNYMTHILEDIQMEKTSNVTEELILYSFLGVFVIFIVDSFTRAGKYYR